MAFGKVGPVVCSGASSGTSDCGSRRGQGRGRERRRGRGRAVVTRGAGSSVVSQAPAHARSAAPASVATVLPALCADMVVVGIAVERTLPRLSRLPGFRAAVPASALVVMSSRHGQISLARLLASSGRC
ncbi:hypothetical protein FB639_002028 [Coemansia asiatica]|nr:hypothetical protein FB639_002028 [Coemansia asiatica]